MDGQSGELPYGDNLDSRDGRNFFIDEDNWKN